MLSILESIVNEVDYNKTKTKILNLFKLCTETNKDLSEIYMADLLDLPETFLVSEEYYDELITTIEEDQQNSTNYENNNFYKEYKQIYNNIITLAPEYGCSNIYFNPTFAEEFMKLFIPFMPLWSKSIYKIYFDKYDTRNFTNASIESYFGEIKHLMAKNSVRLGKAPKGWSLL